MRDYEVLRRELTGDAEVAESLHRAQVALKKYHGETVNNNKKFKAAISMPHEFQSNLCFSFLFFYLLMPIMLFDTILV